MSLLAGCLVVRGVIIYQQAARFLARWYRIYCRLLLFLRHDDPIGQLPQVPLDIRKLSVVGPPYEFASLPYHVRVYLLSQLGRVLCAEPVDDGLLVGRDELIPSKPRKRAWVSARSASTASQGVGR
jgi:hypothetical protein